MGDGRAILFVSCLTLALCLCLCLCLCRFALLLSFFLFFLPCASIGSYWLQLLSVVCIHPFPTLPFPSFPPSTDIVFTLFVLFPVAAHPLLYTPLPLERKQNETVDDILSYGYGWIAFHPLLLCCLRLQQPTTPDSFLFFLHNKIPRLTLTHLVQLPLLVRSFILTLNLRSGSRFCVSSRSCTTAITPISSPSTARSCTKARFLTVWRLWMLGK